MYRLMMLAALLVIAAGCNDKTTSDSAAPVVDDPAAPLPADPAIEPAARVTCGDVINDGDTSICDTVIAKASIEVDEEDGTIHVYAGAVTHEDVVVAILQVDNQLGHDLDGYARMVFSGACAGLDPWEIAPLQPVTWHEGLSVFSVGGQCGVAWEAGARTLTAEAFDPNMDPLGAVIVHFEVVTDLPEDPANPDPEPDPISDPSET